jgi:hypothetical protein
MVNYVSLQNTAKRLINKDGLDIVLVYVTLGSYNPSTNSITNTESTVNSKGVRFNYNTKDIDGETIKKDDIKLITATLQQKPKRTDFVEINNERFSIINIKDISPGSTNVYYELQIRK